MGMVCCADERTNREIDLAEPMRLFSTKQNSFSSFEMELPFSRTFVDVFASRVRAAASAMKTDGLSDGTWISLAALANQCTTTAWSGLRDPNSRISKVVTHKVFQKNEPGQISVDSLITFAVLHCTGKAKEKSIVLFSLL